MSGYLKGKIYEFKYQDIIDFFFTHTKIFCLQTPFELYFPQSNLLASLNHPLIPYKFPSDTPSESA